MMRRISRHKLLTALGVLLMAAIIVFILEITNVTHIFHKAINYGSGSIPAQTKSGTSKLIPSVTTNQGASNTAKNSAAQPTSTSAGPISPSGTFVSNHHPDLSGSPYPSQEESTCNTTVGASCSIMFTNGSIVKKLEAQTVNSNGAAFWTWDVKTAGFTQGTWHIQAVAVLNGNTTTSTDPVSLEVGP